MIDGEMASAYQKLNLGDQRMLRRWLWSNVAFGVICLTALIVIAAKLSGDQSGAATAQNAPIAVHAEAK